MKHYIFLTTGGRTLDSAGNENENCQQIADVVEAENALDAYNQLLETYGFFGDFDTCFCYEVADVGRIQGKFDLITDQS